MSADANRKLILVSRIVFGVSMVIFGWQHFMYAQFLVGLVQKWLPAHAFWIYFTGTAMMAAGAAIATGILARVAGFWLGVMFALFFLTLHLPRVLAAIHNQDEITSMFVALAFSGISLIFAASMSCEKIEPERRSRSNLRLLCVPVRAVAKQLGHVVDLVVEHADFLRHVLDFLFGATVHVVIQFAS